jgi:hypothetical protein
MDCACFVFMARALWYVERGPKTQKEVPILDWYGSCIATRLAVVYFYAPCFAMISMA